MEESKLIDRWNGKIKEILEPHGVMGLNTSDHGEYTRIYIQITKTKLFVTRCESSKFNKMTDEEITELIINRLKENEEDTKRSEQ